jgi:prevent-host-death family protein
MARPEPRTLLVSIVELRGRLRHVLNDARRGNRVLVTRDGDPIAVILGLDEWERLAPEEAQAALDLAERAADRADIPQD